MTLKQLKDILNNMPDTFDDADVFVINKDNSLIGSNVNNLIDFEYSIMDNSEVRLISTISGDKE